MKLYGVFDNNQDEPDYFDTYAEAEKCAEEYIDSYNDGDYGWSDDVHHVRIFKIISEATEVDKRTTDEDGEPLANGFDYMCNYHMLPVEPAPAVTVEDVARKVEEMIERIHGRVYDEAKGKRAALEEVKQFIEEGKS